MGFAIAAPAAHAEEECHYGITVVGGPHADRLVGTNCDDHIYGLGGNDHIQGLYGEDTLFGGRGSDVISAKGYSGVIHGGRGWDTCVVPAASNYELYNCENIILT
jgi:Ca2+-binding RTX toxin-like protein